MKKTHYTNVDSKIGRGHVNAQTFCGKHINNEIKLCEYEEKLRENYNIITCKTCLKIYLNYKQNL